VAGTHRVYDLSAARPERWFDKVLEQSSDFHKASQIMGRSTLGLALVAGARISSLTTNSGGLDGITVEFSIGQDSTVRQVPLSEFRRVIAQYLLAPLPIAALPNDPSVEALQAHIGGRYLLEASLFYVRPLELRYELGLSELVLELNDVQHVVTLDDFREVIDDRVRSELGLGQDADAMALDLAVIDRAEEANAHGNWGATVAMLTPWLTPISMLLRTGEAERLTADVHGRLSESLELLGTAYAKMGDLDAANEVLRLGVQWAGESSKAADLFLTLGQASAASDKHGEAIGLLRRALRLGAEERRALPLLAESFAARDQALAAMVCLEQARRSGADDAELGELAAELHDRLGEAWERFEAWLTAAE
jgi:tetratricopeptide (TPR) repeat protein